MNPNKLKQLEIARAKLARLENAVEAHRAKDLAKLPAKYGFSDTESFVEALRAATGGKSKARGRPAGTGGGKRRKRAVITDETRAEVKKMVEAEKTGSEIAKALGISLPSVQNIKKALGLVRKSK